MITTINLIIFILAVIYTLSGELYLENNDINLNNNDKTSENDNSINAESYNWILKNIQSLSIGIVTIGLFIIFNMMIYDKNINNYPILLLFNNTRDRLMLSFNIIFLFYLSNNIYLNIIYLLLFLFYFIFKLYCNVNNINIYIILNYLIPYNNSSKLISFFYCLLFGLILINILIICFKINWLMIVNIVITGIILIIIVTLIYLLRNNNLCDSLFGIN